MSQIIANVLRVLMGGGTIVFGWYLSGFATTEVEKLAVYITFCTGAIILSTIETKSNDNE